MSPLSLTLTKRAVTRARGERWPRQAHRLFSCERRLSAPRFRRWARPQASPWPALEEAVAPPDLCQTASLPRFWGQDASSHCTRNNTHVVSVQNALATVNTLPQI